MANIDFQNIEEVQQYVDMNLNNNNANNIKGIEHNNIETGLIKFIKESPRNWDKTFVTNSNMGAITTNAQSTIILGPNFSGPLSLKENKWNEWTVVNMTSSNKQLTGGDFNTYYSPAGAAKTYVVANSILKLIKGNDDKWYETDNSVNSTISVDQTVQQGSTEPVSGNAVFEALQNIDVESVSNIDNSYEF